ncbi:helix-turn-helix domain-containing protein [Lactiplantibacillus modestisalitolerans]|uniref:Helix-turn-helix domain-containing protein n=1 Tax=Lactiplantibacillus modestisalitolerans TaxID=1457219 RepID=A0ABV5WS59_9LACO|nr:helix-turn-helix transcriptional regulator [Lactiplantibacillus modestisalitolerans]
MQFTLKQVLAERHWTIGTVAKNTGVSRATLTNIYYGHSKGIQLKTLSRLCEFLGVTPNDLISLKK